MSTQLQLTNISCHITSIRNVTSYLLGDRCSNRSKGLKFVCLGTQAQFLTAKQDHRLASGGFSGKVNCSCCII